MTNTNNNVRWGDICLINFGTGCRSEQCGLRPALVVQNDMGNAYSPTTIVCPLTTKNKKYLPTHMTITPDDSGLRQTSTVLFEQIRTVDKARISKKIGHIDESLKENIKKCLTISFGMI